MGTAVEFVKARVVGIATTITMLGTIIGGTFAFEARYAKAADVDKVQLQQVEIYQNMRIQQNLAVDTLRRQNIEDRLFELRLKEKPTRADQALIERYKEQLQELNGRAVEYQRQLKSIER